jgi:hypothetical protein
MAELGLDGSGFASGLHRAQGLAEGAAHSIGHALIGMVGIGTAAVAIEKTVESAKGLVDASERLGIGVENIQVLKKAAADAGAEFETLEKTFERIDVARRKALTPGVANQGARQSFAALGVGAEQLRSMTAAQLFMGPMAATARSTNPEALAGPMRDILGKGFGEMIPVLKTNFDELGASMKKYGGIMDAETAVKLKALSDQFTMLAQIIAANLGPALVKLAEFIYTNLLKGGKALAGASASAGAGTATMSGWQQAKMYPQMLGWGANDLFHRVFMGRSEEESKKYIKGKMAGAGFNVKAAESATAAAEAPWQGKLDEFSELMKRMAEKAKELNNPAAPDFAGAPSKLTRKALEVPGDSLTRVGNFLGGSQSAIQRMAAQRTEYLRQIALNTGGRKHGGGPAPTVAAGILANASTTIIPHY